MVRSDGDRPPDRTAEVDLCRSWWPANVGDDELVETSALLGSLSPVVFRAGKKLFTQGDPGERAYVLYDGFARVNCCDTGGRERLIAIAGPGDVVGELAVFDPGPRTSTVTALSDVGAGWLDRTILRRCAAQRPAMLQELLRLLARQVKHRHDHWAAALGADPPRLARVLIHLGARVGTEKDGAVAIPIGLTDDELADLTGIARDESRRLLDDFEGHNWIRREPRAIVLLDRSALEQIAREPLGDGD